MASAGPQTPPLASPSALMRAPCDLSTGLHRHRGAMDAERVGGWMSCSGLAEGVAGAGALAALAVAARSGPGVSGAAESGPAAGEFSGYRLAPGDRVRITVCQNPDLTVETRLNDAGTLSHPWVGVLPLGGLDVGAAKRRVADALRVGQFVRQPQVPITLLENKGNSNALFKPDRTWVNATPPHGPGLAHPSTA